MALIFGPFSSPTTLPVTDTPASCSGVAGALAVHHQYGLERHFGPDGLAQQLHPDTLALGHALLLASGPDDGIHKGEILAQNGVVEGHAPAPQMVHSLERVLEKAF